MHVQTGALRRSIAARSGAAAAGVVAILLCSSCSTSSSAQNTSASGGSSSAATTACIDATQKFLAPYAKPPTALPAAFTPLSKPPAPGGTIIRLVQQAVPADQALVPAEAAAAKSIGWTAKAIDYDGSVQDLNAKLTQAIAEKPTVIGVSAADPASIPLPLAAAKRAGIVVSITGSPDNGPTGFPGYSAASYGSKTGLKIADIMANWVMNDSKCNAHVAVANLAGNSVSELETTRIKADLAATCHACTLNSVPVQEQQLGSPSVTNAIVSALQAAPSTNYLIATLGNITDGLAASLGQAGLGHVKIVGATPDPASIKALQNGTDAMYVGISPEITGYVELDAALRSLDAHALVFDDDLPLTVLTQSNVPKGSTAIPAYPADFASLFQKAWNAG